MSQETARKRNHNHYFHRPYSSAKRRTWFVILLTGVMMVFELTTGILTNSMALLADGLHVSPHLAALSITVVACIGLVVTLFSGKFFDWAWMDPVMGIAGSLVIALWSYGLLRSSAAILIDGQAHHGAAHGIREAIETDSETRIADLHVWRVGASHLAVIVSVVISKPRPAEHYKELLYGIHNLSHVTVEVNTATPAGVI